MNRQRLRIVVALVLGALCVLAGPSRASAQDTADELQLTASAPATQLALGDRVELSIDVTNPSDAPEREVIVHIDITDLGSDESVDPDDWTPELTRNLGTMAPGSSKTITWTLQPFTAGSFVTYVVGLSPDSDVVASSNAIALDVTSQRTLNPGGLLPVAVGVPAVVGLLLVVRLRRLGHLTRPTRSSRNTDTESAT